MVQTWQTPDGHTIDVYIPDVVTLDNGQVIRRPPEQLKKEIEAAELRAKKGASPKKFGEK
jgi:hypothetical protein